MNDGSDVRSETLYAEWDDVQARVRDAVEWVLGDHEETEPPPTKEQAKWARQMADRIVDQAMMHLDGYTASDITALPPTEPPR